MTDDTADRERIRTAFDDTLLVEAAAGTGKTTVLVDRIVNLVAAGRAEIDRIVAVTFTEKAAGELKLRLRLELEKARTQAGDRSPEAGRIENALMHLEQAHVSTIHSFCAELLRERPVESAVDPQFEVLPEADAERLYGDVFDMWLQRTLEAPPEGVRRSLRRIPSRFDRRESPVGRLRDAGWTLATWRDFQTAWRRDPFARNTEVDTLVERLHAFADLTRRPSSQSDNLYVGTQRARQASDEVRTVEQARARDHDGLEAILVDLSHDRDFANPRKGYGSQYGAGLARPAVLSAHAELVSALHTFRRAADADLAALLRDELRGPIERYQQLKQAMGRLDFVDLLISARDLLHDHALVRAEFQRRFTHIFVDEFQDTDPLQAEILLLLAATDPSVSNWRQVSPAPGKFFSVGDPKQSIYRFRRADVGIYQEVRSLLIDRGATPIDLTTSFRAVPAIQRLVNTAFAPLMTGDSELLQARYVHLRASRPDHEDQPAVIALPVPRPYGAKRIAQSAIEASLPDAVGAFIDWLIRESRWTVTERDGPNAPVALEPRHICVLFRRFEKYREDMTRRYVDALEARAIPHLLVGGKSFHAREEVESLRTALSAIEWPDDELSVFATLRGALFSIGDEALLEYRHAVGRLDPFARRRAELPDRLAPIASALDLLQSLNRDRNRVPVTETIARLLQDTRAHAGLVLRQSGEQALANVLQIAEMARRYEHSEGLSFRGFVDQLRDEATVAGDIGEAPIMEEGTEGVRIMTVHRAKGLEFPVVILADITANLAHQQASRYLDPERGLCAVRLAGWSPADLLDHEAQEVERDRQEGIRVAYVAATRARDLLVVPAVGDAPYEEKWVSALNPALYPSLGGRRSGAVAPGCPSFGKDSVLDRPDGDPAGPENVSPGLHLCGDQSQAGDPRNSGPCRVVWWDPKRLVLGATPSFGLRRLDLIAPIDDEAMNGQLARHDGWKARREEALRIGATPSVNVKTASERARETTLDGAAPDVAVIEIEHAAARPGGRRYGTLVHAVIAAVPLDGSPEQVERLAVLHGRVLGASAGEVASAAALVSSLLAHPLLVRARDAAARSSCRREAPVTVREADRSLVDGVIDLAFEEPGGWMVVDFKTDRDVAADLNAYRRQLQLYAEAVARATGRPATALLMRV